MFPEPDPGGAPVSRLIVVPVLPVLPPGPPGPPGPPADAAAVVSGCKCLCCGSRPLGLQDRAGLLLKAVKEARSVVCFHPQSRS